MLSTFLFYHVMMRDSFVNINTDRPKKDVLPAITVSMTSFFITAENRPAKKLDGQSLNRAIIVSDRLIIIFNNWADSLAVALLFWCTGIHHQPSAD